MCVRMHVCMHVMKMCCQRSGICVHVSVCMYACTSSEDLQSLYACTYTCDEDSVASVAEYMRACICMYLCMYVFRGSAFAGEEPHQRAISYVYMYMCACVRPQIYTYIVLGCLGSAVAGEVPHQRAL
jgi:hypothetical protein